MDKVSGLPIDLFVGFFRITWSGIDLDYYDVMVLWEMKVLKIAKPCLSWNALL